MESKHTKGKAEIFDHDTVSIDGYSVASIDCPYRILDNWGEKGLRHWSEGNGKIDISDEEVQANAQLIADAFNVTNETGMTPRELQKSHAELLRQLTEIKELMHRHIASGAITYSKEVSVSKLAIKEAEQAIKKATK